MGAFALAAKLECGHWIEAAIEAKYKLIEIRLQMLATHAMMGSEQPSLQIREGNVNHRHVSICHFWVAV